MKRRWKILLVLVVVAVICIAILMPRGGSRRAVEAYKQELRARGEKLTMAELAPPKPTNSSIAARVVATTPSYGPKFQADFPALMKPMKPGVAQIGYTNLPSGLMSNFQENILLVSQMRSNLQQGALEFDLDYSMGNGMLLPHLAALKRVEWLAASAAAQGLYSRNFDQAWLDLLTAINLARQYSNEPLMISGLVRAADARIALSVTWESLQAHEWTDAQLRELQAAWQDMDLFKTSADSLAMERAFMLETFAQARTFKDRKFLAGAGFLTPVAPVAGPGRGAPTEYFVAWLGELYENQIRFRMWKSSWSHDEELCSLQSSGAALESARRVKATGIFLPAYAEFQRKTNEIAKLHPDSSRHFLFETGTGEVYGNYLLKLARVETGRRLLVAVIALQRFKLKHGSYPAKLDELVPEYLERVPTDFLDGQPLRYRLNPDGSFVLYSIGVDGQDNGGDPSPATALYVGGFEGGRDIVWPRAATAKEIAAYEKEHPDRTLTNTPGK